MLARILEIVTGKDDVERVASRQDLRALNAYLKKRRLWIPRKPKRFLDAATFTPEQLVEALRQEAEELAGESFEPWVMEIEGKKRLPAFSNLKKMEIFSGKVSKELDKVFGLGAVEFLVEDIIKDSDIDFVDLNPLNEMRWEICVRKG